MNADSSGPRIDWSGDADGAVNLAVVDRHVVAVVYWHSRSREWRWVATDRPFEHYTVTHAARRRDVAGVIIFTAEAVIRAYLAGVDPLEASDRKSRVQEAVDEDARHVLDQAVAELRQLPYSKLRRRVKMKWTWDAPPPPPPGTEGNAHYVDLVPPTVRLRRGPSGIVHRVLTFVTWANREKDLEVTVLIDEDDEPLSQKVRFIESFIVPRGHRP